MRKRSGKVLTWVRKVSRRDRGNRLPQRGERSIVLAYYRWQLYLTWRPRIGYRVVAFGLGDLPNREHYRYDPEKESESKVKRRVVDPLTLKMPPLPSESKVLVKFPLLCEWLSSRQYDDGSDRTPGDVRIRPGIVDFEGTLYDPDAGMRCSVRAKTLDDLLTALNLLCGAENAPWEVDKYLTEQLAKKPKKKK